MNSTYISPKPIKKDDKDEQGNEKGKKIKKMRINIKVKEENGDKMEDEKNPEKKQDILAKSQCPLTCLGVHKITFFYCPCV